MITKIYWIARILGYIACLAGIFYFLAHQPDADPSARTLGLGFVGLGFVGFFVSYAIRVWLRYGFGRKPEKE